VRLFCALILERSPAVTACPRRSIVYAQNFLTNARLVDRLLDTSTIGPADTVYEIGPGRGLITARLALRCRAVVAIEKDPVLVPPLRHRFAGTPHVRIREADFLEVALPRAPYKVFANIPFNITTAIVTKLIAASCPPDDAYLVVQKEAAVRFAGLPRESLIAVLIKLWFEPAIWYRFRRTDFAPEPGADVVLLRLRKRGPPLVARADAQVFRDFVIYTFTARQPSLRHTLRGILSARQLIAACREAGVDPDSTPSEVCCEQWVRLFHAFSSIADGQGRQAIRGAEARLKCQQAQLQKIHRTRATSMG
jgi:23S rRNA (adenine-N6)-dimethyltransferase